MADQVRADAAHAGHGPVPTTARLQARWPERSQTPQAGARARSALGGGLWEFADLPEWPVHLTKITLIGLRQAKQQRRARSPA